MNPVSLSLSDSSSCSIFRLRTYLCLKNWTCQDTSFVNASLLTSFYCKLGYENVQFYKHIHHATSLCMIQLPLLQFSRRPLSGYSIQRSQLPLEVPPHQETPQSNCRHLPHLQPRSETTSCSSQICDLNLLRSLLETGLNSEVGALRTIMAGDKDPNAIWGNLARSFGSKCSINSIHVIKSKQVNKSLSPQQSHDTR